MNFEAITRGPAVIFRLGESLEWEDAKNLDDAIKEHISAGYFHVVFDLSRVNRICSAGIGTLVYNIDTVRKNNGDIYIVSSGEYIDYLFKTLCFDRVFSGRIFKSVDECEKKIAGQTNP
jgi:anti-anti-sigma factor